MPVVTIQGLPEAQDKFGAQKIEEYITGIKNDISAIAELELKPEDISVYCPVDLLGAKTT